MKWRLSAWIGWRYLRAKHQNHFISFISLASVIGIALGVAVLITVLSVMNGFDSEIKKRFFALEPQLTVMVPRADPQTWIASGKHLAQADARITGFAPFVSGGTMLMRGGSMHGAYVLGINPVQEAQISQLPHLMVAGSLASLQPGTYHVVLGQALAKQLGLTLGDRVTVITSQVTQTPIAVLPRYRQFTVTGLFTGHGFDVDNLYAYINLDDAYQLLGHTATQGFHLTLNNIYQSREAMEQLRQQLPATYSVADWTMQAGSLFDAIAMQKTMMMIILLLIVAIAAFNLVSSLVMVVNEKQADIAILRTIGATPNMIMWSFVVQGLISGLMGIFFGIIAGVCLAWNATAIVNAVQNLLHVQFVSAAAYWVDFLPSELQWADVWHIAGLALLLSFLATLYPAWRAFRVAPAEALRYE